MEETEIKRVNYTTRLDEGLIEWLKHQAVTEKKRTNVLIEEGIRLLQKARKESGHKKLLER